MKKSEIKNLDLLWSLTVKRLAKNKCEVSGASGKVERLNACHIIGRRYRATRWGCWIDDTYDLCGFSGTYKCHMQYDEHGPQESYIREKVIGQQRYDTIRKIAIQTVADNQDYKEIRAILQKIHDLKRLINKAEV